MKKFLLVALILASVQTAAFAQWGGGFDVGQTTRHRFDVTTADTWMSNPFAGRTDDIKLDGYNAVRADFSVTDDTLTVVCNLMCSNDSIWVSGDAITVTRDSYSNIPLRGCKDYYMYINSITSSDRVTVWLTPYNEK